MSKLISNWLAELDTKIKTGRADEAWDEMSGCKLSNIPRESKTELARLARRIHQGHYALRVLNPIVRPKGRKVITPTPQEISEYAAALNMVGATEEAIELFKTVDPKKAPEVLLLESYAHFSQWEYAKARPRLQRFIQAMDADSYWKLVGLANYAAAMVFLRDPSAQPMIAQILHIADTEKQRILYGYALQLQAENQIWNHHWEKANEFLSIAFNFFQKSDSLENLFIRKWKAIVELYENPIQYDASAFDVLREEAIKRSHWETLRSIDYHIAVATKDQELFTHVSFGTPFKTLTDKLAEDFGDAPSLPESWHWQLVPGSKKYCFSVDSICEGRHAEKKGGALYRLVSTLATDFYRPIRTAEIHSKLFPGEFFNPVSSAHRVSQLISRLREHWKKSESPMLIVEQNGAYRLSCSTPCEIKVERVTGSLVDTQRIRSVELRDAFGTKPFGMQDVCKVLKLSPSQSKRVLARAIEQGELTRTGAGKNTKYSVNS